MSSITTLNELYSNLLENAFAGKVTNLPFLEPYVREWQKRTKSKDATQAMNWIQLMMGVVHETLIAMTQQALTPCLNDEEGVKRSDAVDLVLYSIEEESNGQEWLSLYPIETELPQKNTFFGGIVNKTGLVIPEFSDIQYQAIMQQKGTTTKRRGVIDPTSTPTLPSLPFVFDVQEYLESFQEDDDVPLVIKIHLGLIYKYNEAEVNEAVVAWAVDAMEKVKMRKLEEILEKSKFSDSDQQRILSLFAQEPVPVSTIRREYQSVYNAIYNSRSIPGWKMFGFVSATFSLRRLSVQTYLHILKRLGLQRVVPLYVNIQLGGLEPVDPEKEAQREEELQSCQFNLEEAETLIQELQRTKTTPPSTTIRALNGRLETTLQQLQEGQRELKTLIRNIEETAASTEFSPEEQELHTSLLDAAERGKEIEDKLNRTLRLFTSLRKEKEEEEEEVLVPSTPSPGLTPVPPPAPPPTPVTTPERQQQQQISPSLQDQLKGVTLKKIVDNIEEITQQHKQKITGIQKLFAESESFQSLLRQRRQEEEEEKEEEEETDWE